MSKEVISNGGINLNSQAEVANNLDQILLNIPSLVENNISVDLLKKIGESMNNDRLVLFIGNHQSYFESEIWTQMAKGLSKVYPDFKGIYLPYSAPATDSNIGVIFNKRKKYYNDNKLFMLPVIREADRTSEKYSRSITPEMERSNLESIYKMVHARKEHYAIVCLPEGSLKAGRTNPETGEIFGMQHVTDETFLDLVFKKDKTEGKGRPRINKLVVQTDLVPIGIDGCYRIFSSDNYTFSNQIPLWIKNQEKIITINSKKVIPATEYYQREGNIIEAILDNEVAPLVSPKAQGVFLQANRINLNQF